MTISQGSFGKSKDMKFLLGARGNIRQSGSCNLTRNIMLLTARDMGTMQRNARKQSGIGLSNTVYEQICLNWNLKHLQLTWQKDSEVHLEESVLWSSIGTWINSCSSGEMSKAKRSSFKSNKLFQVPKEADLLHMDLCGPITALSKDGTPNPVEGCSTIATASSASNSNRDSLPHNLENVYVLRSQVWVSLKEEHLRRLMADSEWIEAMKDELHQFDKT
ncbi:hypothetical protein Tco_1132231 [Tanacetum coccineum]|uniref:Uncharacterized protein n=1 Tax=Tanacetum coccineum TaxID=301880 RepID=A0ABQ5JCQ7_9ASTR